MIDFHAHILPKMDDGSKDVEMSVAMLVQSLEQGVKRIHLTPHFYGDCETPQRFIERRQEAFSKLQEGIEGISVPQMKLGAEVAYYPGVSHCDALPQFCIEDTNLILIEPPFTPWTDRFYGEIESLRRQSFQPVIAHVERYFSVEPQKKTLAHLRDVGALIQCNGEFFHSGWHSRKAFTMIKKGEIDFLGSDCHNLTSRAPDLRETVVLIQRKLGDQMTGNFLQRTKELLEACSR